MPRMPASGSGRNDTLSRDGQAKPPQEQLQLYTVSEAAKLLGVSRAHAYRLVADGDLRIVDVRVKGSSKPKSRVRADDLADFIARRTEGTTP
jgi:excisionase family DNA binding protein